MTRLEIIELYKKEREYQEEIFGDYSDINCLNIASFLQFIETYLIKAKKAYTNTWSNELPPWLIYTRESFNQGTAPVEAYEQLVKVYALAGAALEAYAEIDPNEWRKDGIKSKWIKK